MINNITAVTNIGYAGLVHAQIRKMHDAGEETPETKEMRVADKLDEERKKVVPIYNSQGKIIEYDKWGRHINVFV